MGPRVMEWSLSDAKKPPLFDRNISNTYIHLMYSVQCLTFSRFLSVVSVCYCKAQRDVAGARRADWSEAELRIVDAPDTARPVGPTRMPHAGAERHDT